MLRRFVLFGIVDRFVNKTRAVDGLVVVGAEFIRARRVGSTVALVGS